MDYTRPAEDSKIQDIRRFNQEKENKHNEKRLKKLQEMANGKQGKQEKAHQEKLQLYTIPNEIKDLIKQGKITLDKRIKGD